MEISSKCRKLPIDRNLVIVHDPSQKNNGGSEFAPVMNNGGRTVYEDIGKTPMVHNTPSYYP